VVTGLSRSQLLSAGLFLVMSLLIGCSQKAPVRSNLPPSESDLVLLKSVNICAHKPEFLTKQAPATATSRAWGSGEELTIPAGRSASQGDESYFFDEDGLLVGALFTFPKGLDLEPYPALRRTLSLLKPVLEFYLNVSQLEAKAKMDTSSILETGTEKSTTQYLVTGLRDHPILLQASFTVDPYVRLFSPYRREFMDRLRNPPGGNGGQKMESQGSEDKEPFLSLQQFARGQVAQLAYCGDKNYDIAVDAYQKSTVSGFTNKVWMAEAHHKLGLAWAGKSQYDKAKAELLRSLAIRPNIPEVLNNLGTVHVKLGEKSEALGLFEKAVVLRPNYAVARYNLAEAYEDINTKRAIGEYETFLALVAGIPEEEARAAHARGRIEALKR
jgi:tetratricopeptide (TPR) repeat protein